MEHEPCHGKTEMSAGPTTKPSPPPAEDATAASKVFGNDDLLSEILRRVDSPTTLVRAALASKRWLRRASGRAFLRRFRERHPPRLVGFYVTGDSVHRPEFVPMPPGTELGATLRRAATMFDAFPPCSSRVWHTRNSRVLFDFSRVLFDPRSFAVRDPLRHPPREAAMAEAELPPPPAACEHAMLLPDDEDDDATCYCVEVNHDGRSVAAEVSVLRSGAWTVLCCAKAELAWAPERIPMITLLAGGKVYMVAVAGYLVAVDLATASLFAVDLPKGAAYEYYGNLVPSRGDDSVLYLFHVTGDQLRVWRRRMDDGAGEWALRDTVSVKETCGHLVEQGSDPANGDPLLPVSVAGVGDNAEFAFLELGYSGNIVVYLHLGSRKAEKVYDRDPDNDEIIEVHPLFTVWPPVFPALGADKDEELHLGNAN